MPNAIKKAVSLLFLCLASYTLHATKIIKASDIDAPQIEVFDHTATHNNKQIDHTVDFQDLDDEDLADDVDTLCLKAKDNPNLLAVILTNQSPHKKANNLETKYDEQRGRKHGTPTAINMAQGTPNGIYKKYVLDASGLLDSQAHRTAQKLGYHIVQTGPGPIVVALMQWVNNSPEKHIYDISTNVPVCSKCQYLLTLMGYTANVKSCQKECQASSFPWPMPPLAMEYLNSAILNSGQPLEMMQTILQRIPGISETSYNVLKDNLNKTQLKLENKENLLSELQAVIDNKEKDLSIKIEDKDHLLEQLKNDNKQALAKKDNEIQQLEDQFKQKENQFNQELEKKEKELERLKEAMKYKGKSLPQDLSGQNLTGYDFTGCQFTYTDFTNSDLESIILTNTTCDYQKAFLDNIKKNKLENSNWHKENLPNDLQSIAKVYPKLNNNTHKVRLLAIASGLAWLPFYEDTEFYIKVEYWSSQLLQLKQVLRNAHPNQGFSSWFTTTLDKQLVCSLQNDLEYDVDNYCWTTNYPQDKISIEPKAPHTNFDTYLNDFTNGLQQYQCKSKNNTYGLDWYKETITKNIEGLKQTYPNITDKQLQQEACDIAHALSRSYQIQQHAFLFHYLYCQHRLVQLKKSAGIGNEVYYRVQGWQHGQRAGVANKVYYSRINRCFSSLLHWGPVRNELYYKVQGWQHGQRPSVANKVHYSRINRYFNSLLRWYKK